MEPFKLPSIPTPKPNDPEDVSWALSTAEAMWGRGDHAEAIKWIRRGAEAASEAEADDRALELAKAAADLASMIVRMSQPDPSSARPPVGSPGPPPMTGAPPRASGAPQITGAPQAAPPAPAREATREIPSVAPVPVTTRSVPPPSVAPPRGVSPSVAPRPLQAARGPERVLSSTKGVLSPRIENKRRRSSANLDEEARVANKRAERTERVERPEPPREEPRRTHADAPQSRDPATSEDGGTHADQPRGHDPESTQHGHEPDGPVTTDELGRTSEHDSMAAALSSMAMALPQPDDARPQRKKSRKSRTNEGGPRSGSVTDEWDAQPTQSLSRAELDSITNEHSLPQRMIGGAMVGKSKDLLPPLETSPRGQLPDPMDSEPGSAIVATQAVRVLLWRDAEGVHVAPSGTVVSAIAVDAILVALSPSVDLSAWLDPGLMSGRIAPSPSSEARDGELGRKASAGLAQPATAPKSERAERNEKAERNERAERAERNEKARGKLPK